MIIILMKTGKDSRQHYYTVHDRQQLLDLPYAYSASWRVGMGREREKIHGFQSLGERDRSLRNLIAKRMREGYRLLYSFSRAGFGPGTESVLTSRRFGSKVDAPGQATALVSAAGGSESRQAQAYRMVSGERRLPRPDGEL